MKNSKFKTQDNLSAYQKAKEDVQTLKSFYFSLISYVIVNIVIFYVWYAYSGAQFQWFWFPIIGWGIGIAVKALYVYDVNFIYGKQWEKQKIQEIMMNENHEQTSDEEVNQAYAEAKKKVDSIKGFYSHFLVYILVNTFIVATIVWDTNIEILSFEALSTPIFWGIGLAAHALGVFGEDLFFGKDWEERKIKKLMDAEL